MPKSLPEPLPETPQAQFLQVYLDHEWPFLLPVEHLVEIMKLETSQVVPMFHMPPWVMGIYNWRGEVLWMADLSHFLGCTPWYDQAKPNPKHTVVLIRAPQSTSPGETPPTVGLVVSRVEGIVSIPMEAIQAIPARSQLEYGQFEAYQSAPLQFATVELEVLGNAPSIRPFLKGWCVHQARINGLILNSLTILAAMGRSHSFDT